MVLPVKYEFIEMTEITGNILEGGIGDSRAPRQVQAAELPQVLGDQLDPVVRDLGAAGETEHREVGQGVDHVDYAVVGDLPAGVKAEDAEGVALFGTEEGEGSVCHVICLQVQLVQRWQQLRYGAHRIVGDVDAVTNTERYDLWVEAGPQASLRDLVTTRELQPVDADHFFK